MLIEGVGMDAAAPSEQDLARRAKLGGTESLQLFKVSRGVSEHKLRRGFARPDSPEIRRS